MHAKKDDGASEWLDPDDAPELTDAFFDQATYEIAGVEVPKRKGGRPPKAVEDRKKFTSLRLDPDVLAHFQASGRGWRTRINEALRKAAGLDPSS